jgi:hypothetical protein
LDRAGAFFPAGYARPDIQLTVFLHILRAADGVVEVAVTPVDDNVAVFEVGKQLVDERIDGGTGLDEQYRPTGPFQCTDEFLNGVCRDDRFSPRRRTGDKVVHLRDRPVEGGNAVSLVVHVQNEVLAHYGEAY